MSHTFEPTRAPDGRSRASREPEDGVRGGPAPGGPDAPRLEAAPDGVPGIAGVPSSGSPTAGTDLGMSTTFPGGRPPASAAAHRLATQAVDLGAVRDEQARQAAVQTAQQAVQQAARDAARRPSPPVVERTAAQTAQQAAQLAAQQVAQQAAQQAAQRAAQHATRAAQGAADAASPASSLGQAPLGHPLGQSPGGPAAGPAVPQGTAYLTGPQGVGPARTAGGPSLPAPATGQEPPQAGRAPRLSGQAPAAGRATSGASEAPAPSSPDVLAASAAVLDLAQAAVDLEPAMALAGRGFAGAQSPAWGPSSAVAPSQPRPGDVPDGESRRSRRDAVQASAQTPDDREERAARRGRSGLSGPAAGRALGSKVSADAPPRGGDRGARSAGGRRYLPLPDPAPEPLPDGRTDADRMPTTEPPRVPDMPTTEPMHATGPLAAGPGAGPGAGPVAAQPVMPPGTGSVPWLQDEAQPSFTGAFAPSFDAYPTGSQPPVDDPFGDTGTRLLRAVDDDEPAPDGPAPSLVRPYSRTGGRTKPGRELDLEALVVTTVNGREAWSSPLLNPEHVQVIGLCMDTTSVAEVAAKLSVPIGVARVIIADMVDLGLVEVGKTSANYGDERDPAFLRRVLSGLQRL